MKVLLFANDLMPFSGLPTSGGGLRCFQLMRGLESHGIEVIPAMPGFTYLAEKFKDKIPENVREYLWNFEDQDQILSRVRPDAVLFASNWDHFNLMRKPDIPLIIDLHGSRLVETAMFGTPESAERKVTVLSQADCLITAGKRQRMYFYGWLVQAGRVPENEHFIRYIPISLSPELPQRKHSTQDPKADTFPIFVSGGGWFPWQNQVSVLSEICNQVKSRNRGSVEIYGTPHKDLAPSPTLLEIERTYEKIKSLSQESNRIRTSDYIAREDLMNRYLEVDIAVELMRYNLERELAFTTRTIEYLWCGLPVIYNNYAEISEHISAYDAGWTLDPDDPTQLKNTLEEVFSSPEICHRKSQNAQKLVMDRFTWDKTIVPLVDFLQHPTIFPPTLPVLGAVHSRPSFLNPQGQQLEVLVPLPTAKFKQRFVIPAENIAAIELSYRIPSNIPKLDSLNICFELRRPNGTLICKRSFPIKNIRQEGQLSLPLPFYRQPGGGEVMDLYLTTEGNAEIREMDNYFLALSCIANANYPLWGRKEIRNSKDTTFAEQQNPSTPYFFETNFAKNSGAEVLALSFLPAEFSQVYQIKMLAKRAVLMVKQGEWKRFFRALRRRLPGLGQKLRDKLTRLIGNG